MPTPNRAFRESFPFAANGLNNIRLKLFPRTGATLTVQWENRGDKPAAVKMQDAADDGTGLKGVLADVAGSTATVVPGGTVTLLVTVRQFFEFTATGGTEVEAIVSGDVFAHEVTKV